MAETVAFTLVSKVLSTIASPAFSAAYKEGLSIWEAKDELSKLQVTIETIQAVLLDAEKRQQDSAAVRNWIKRLKSVLYDADDLFDEVATRDLLKQQIRKGNHNLISKKVLISSSKLNPIISRYSIAKEVKAIRKSLVEISTDMAQFEFLRCQHEEPMSVVRKGRNLGCFVDAEVVIGREDDKKAVLEMLFDELDNVVPIPLVIAIVGIGGLGKTTLAQLIYNDDEVKRNFDNQWFACISDTSDEREVLGKVFQSLEGGDHSSFSVSQLQTRIRNFVKDKRFLLVLDDVWDDHRGRWQDRMSLLRSCAKGSRIIVTTRLRSVVDAVNASRDHNLEGLSEENAWCLFKSLAFAEDYENDPRRISLGKKILKKCKGVPLAIRSVGSLLSERNTIFEWQEIEREGLRTIGKKYHDETMSVIKLSYDHLPLNLKHCFAYCSLFPKDYKFKKRELICFWIAQGYIEPNNEESSFMHLLRRGFFQEATTNVLGEVRDCKMHDIMHDLALYVAGGESVALSGTSRNTSSFTRHASVEDCERDVQLLKDKPLRSLLLMGVNSACCSKTMDKLFQNFKMLRTLSLEGLHIREKLPSSIGELKLLRYLNLSFNYFIELPDSITNLMNLLALNLTGCSSLKVLPEKFRKLINLKYLNIEGCGSLETTPIGMEELTRLQYLSRFVVWKGSGIDTLVRLQQQLRGELLIQFADGIEDQDECNWKLPVSLQKLEIKSYPGIRIPNWSTIDKERTSNHLAFLRLDSCLKVKHLPPLHCLPNLRWLHLEQLVELEFVESGEDYSGSSSFFPCLQRLILSDLPKLKKWMKSTTAIPTPEFPLLSDLSISHCPMLGLASFPLCRHLQELALFTVDTDGDVTPRQLPSTLFFPSVSTPLKDLRIYGCEWLSSLQVEATTSLRYLAIYSCSSLKSLEIRSPELRLVEIEECEGLVSIEAATPSLKFLTIRRCKGFKNLVKDNSFSTTLAIILALPIAPSLYFLRCRTIVIPFCIPIYL